MYSDLSLRRNAEDVEISNAHSACLERQTKPIYKGQYIDEFFRTKGETVALAVVIVESPYIRGLKFEVDIVEALRSRPVIDELLGVLTRTKQPKETIGIVVGLTMGNFTPGAINTALEIAEPPEPSEPLKQLPTYPIIVTDKTRLPKYLINA
ncbi:33475_t:CDS:2, partial [Racocetra persica]